MVDRVMGNFHLEMPGFSQALVTAMAATSMTSWRDLVTAKSDVLAKGLDGLPCYLLQVPEPAVRRPGLRRGRRGPGRARAVLAGRRGERGLMSPAAPTPDLLTAVVPVRERRAAGGRPASSRCAATA